MKVMFVASEAEPFAKTGGLADVVGTLPRYLKKIGIDVRIVIPKYKSIKSDLVNKLSFIKHFNVPVGWRNQYCGIFQCEYDGIIYYFIDNEYYFKRDKLYGYYDDGERFAFFDRAVLNMLWEINYKPDIIHCNDWQTGMIPTLYKIEYKQDSFYQGIKFLFSIHNLLFQGNFDKCVLGELFNLDEFFYENGSVELNGAVSYMKSGINYSDKISTVSTSYAKEIQTPEYGENLDGLLRSRKDDLWGITNGIDYNIYNPKKDRIIFKKYTKYNLWDKKVNKVKLQKELNINIDEEVPMIAIISRFTPQKGMDIIENICERLISKNIQLVVLGTGYKEYEDYFRYIASKYPKSVSANIYFDDILAHKIYAGADMFLMPSLFEPCGLGQLIALRYGTVPIVRETGGLKDTVKPYNKYTGEGNGFSFSHFNGDEFLNIISNALGYFRQKNIWNNIVRHAMESDNSWNNSANLYKKLYESL
ncbi:glycogen synthase GlgA [Clostridium sp. cel8]|jgi:starch synthase|uniref:glycogen synthase GlgA n=1 Tax=unclassified Clostridium TaxID=2614128 RepID=UPI0015F48C83|nr:glycogen synthase GlgA [Clostridium sp. cel8]MBA5851707.1 glycogen synthase GlgA [Clostridium sp. cel8]